MSWRDWILHWDGRVFIARDAAGEIRAAFCDRDRAEAMSLRPVVEVTLNMPEVGPTIYQRAPEEQVSPIP